MNNGPEDLKLERDAGHTAAAAEVDANDPELEAALRQALRPELAPAGFTDRVMARALAGSGSAPVASVASAPLAAATPRSKAKLLHWPQSRLWVTGAVAAALVAGILEGGLAVERVREQRRKIVEATQQFQTTERITVHALAQAREQLQRAGVPLSLD